MDFQTSLYNTCLMLQIRRCYLMDLIFRLRRSLQQINDSMLGQEFQQTNNHNNDFNLGPQNGPTSSTFGYYAQLTPPYSPDSKECTSSVAVPPALQQSSSTYVGDYHGGSNLSHGPFHSDTGVDPTSTLAARVSPSISQQSDFSTRNTSLHENDVNISLPNAKNDGGPFNGPKPGGPEPGQSTRRVSKRKSVKCKKCQVPFDTEVELRTHQEETHFNPEKIIRCPNENCAFVTDLKHHWEYHMKRHGGTKPFGCDLCSYSCINKAMLKSHMKKHSKIFQYHCRDCQVKSNFHHDFKKHLEATRHRQGPTFDEYGNPSDKIIDVGGKRRGLKKPAQKETKICPATVVSPPETSHYSLGPVQVAPLDLSKTGSSINPMDLS